MKNMKITMKLIVSFVIVIVMAIAVGVTGIIGMSRINSADVAMYNGNYLPSVMAGNISQKIVEQRVLIRNFVIYDANTDAELFQGAEKSLSTSRTDMEKLFADYKLAITNPEDQAAYDELVKTYNNDWAAMVNSIHNYGSANQKGQAKDALSSAVVIAGKMDELTTTLQQVNMSDGQKAIDSNAVLFKTMTIMSVVILALAVAVSIFLAIYISGLISKPMVFMKNVLAGFGTQGNLTLSDTEYDRAKKIATGKDEVAQSMDMLLATFMRLNKVGQALETVAGGDLTVELALLSEKDTIGRSLHTMLDNLNNMFSEINSATAQVSIGSKQIADGAQSLAQGSTQQASAVQELSASISEIADKTKENAEMAIHAADLAGNIKQNAEKGNMQMDQMMQAVKEINEASQSISKVIGVIDNIAFQTNILALNAAVEAARAGQHGKGFAVVAEEVRSLASKSAEAAKETGALIANSMDKAEMGARIADETASSLVEIVSGINESTRIVGDIAQSSNAQATAITEINSGIDQVAQVVQQNSATAEQSAAASEQMSGQADSLEQLIAQFKLKDSHQRSLGTGPRKAQRGIPENISYDGDSGLGMGKY